MATRHMNLQSVLFLNHEIQGLLFKYNDEKCLYLSTKVAKSDLKPSKIAKLCNVSSDVWNLLPMQLRPKK